MTGEAVIPVEEIQRAIYEVRGLRVMLDEDLARLYGVETRILVRNVKRNINRFPADFLLQLTAEENEGLRSQFGISKSGRGGRRFLPYAFTEQGVAMLSTVLHSERAIEINIEIMRAFVRVRRLVAFEAEIRQRLKAIETVTGEHGQHIGALYEAIHQLMTPPEQSSRRIGFTPERGNNQRLES